jgi:L-fuculose-phosphate aldolase
MDNPRHELVGAISRIYQNGMTTTSGGNLSIRDESGDTWITPARIDKAALRQKDIVRIRPDGTSDGLHPPSSEYPFHLRIYQLRPDIKAIIHAHPAAMVAYSVAHSVPDLSLLPMASRTCGRVDLAGYKMPGSAALGDSIADVFAKGADCVIMENHGVVIGGKDLQEAFGRFETLEACAAIIIRATQLGPMRRPAKVALPAATQSAGLGTASVSLASQIAGPAGLVVRDLCRFIHRGYCRRLFTSTQGSFSARTSADQFVINCHGVDRRRIHPECLATVSLANGEVPAWAGNLVPSLAWPIHQAIYRRHKDVQAIISATPIHATAYGITAEKLDARTLPESYLFMRDVVRIPFDKFASQPGAIAEMVSMSRPAGLLENEGALVVGKSVLDAFDRLEVTEATAAALFQSRLLGPMHPISDHDIDELVRAFS